MADKSKEEQFRHELGELFQDRKMSGMIVVIEGDKSHFAHIGITPGRTIDVLSAVKVNILQRMLLEESPAKKA